MGAATDDDTGAEEGARLEPEPEVPEVALPEEARLDEPVLALGAVLPDAWTVV